LLPMNPVPPVTSVMEGWISQLIRNVVHGWR
jgi:hypothetical protein